MSLKGVLDISSLGEINEHYAERQNIDTSCIADHIFRVKTIDRDNLLEMQQRGRSTKMLTGLDTVSLEY